MASLTDVNSVRRRFECCVTELCDTADERLYARVIGNSAHTLYQLLPPISSSHVNYDCAPAGTIAHCQQCRIKGGQHLVGVVSWL